MCICNQIHSAKYIYQLQRSIQMIANTANNLS